MKDKLRQIIISKYNETPSNEVFLPEGKYNLIMYDEPLIGFADASEPLFEQFKAEEIIGNNFIVPTQWLEGAKSVISLFFPLNAQVRNTNKDLLKYPSEEWLYARIEGHNFINSVAKEICTELGKLGINTCIPSCDSRFSTKFELISNDFHVNSAWSERHIAYVCGLGTFGLSRGIITEKGMAGRLISIITDCEIPPDIRKYSSPYEYCVECKECISRCPVNAISAENKKNNNMCNSWLDITKDMCSPRYGCGKCQVGVSCEYEIPKKVKKQL